MRSDRAAEGRGTALTFRVPGWGWGESGDLRVQASCSTPNMTAPRCLSAKPASCSRAQTGGRAGARDGCAPCSQFKTLHTWVNLQLPVGHRRRLRVVRQSLAGSEPFSNQRTDMGRWHLWVNWWQVPDHTWRRGWGLIPEHSNWQQTAGCFGKGERT